MTSPFSIGSIHLQWVYFPASYVRLPECTTKNKCQLFFGQDHISSPSKNGTKTPEDTLPETNIAPEKLPSQKKTSIPTIHFSCAILNFGGVLEIQSTPSVNEPPATYSTKSSKKRHSHSPLQNGHGKLRLGENGRKCQLWNMLIKTWIGIFSTFFNYSWFGIGLLVWCPVVWDSNRGTPKNPNPFHFRGFLESKPPNPQTNKP